jgi:hypothetical protein
MYTVMSRYNDHNGFRMHAAILKGFNSATNACKMLSTIVTSVNDSFMSAGLQKWSFMLLCLCLCVTSVLGWGSLLFVCF